MTAFPDRYVLQTTDGSFEVRYFAAEGHCQTEPLEGFTSEFKTYWNSRGAGSAWTTTSNAWETIEWEDERFDLITVSLAGDGSCDETTQFLVARDAETALRFLGTVCKWNSEVRGEVLVYNGYWYKDEELFNSIKASTLDNLILEPGLKEEIRNDFSAFLGARETYERYRLPWKRGVLFLGPPGNGKTHCIKALINHLDVPCLYVRTFERDRGSEFGAIRQVFDRARQTAPCVIVFEDLDSIINDKNRSFFLNELDGFAANTGVMIVATTNHPEKLDPAIMDRPSRFDRKFMFRLPDEDLRAEYLLLFADPLEPALQLSVADARAIAEATSEFSFAYLKELYLSAMMAWISGGGNRPIAEVMQENVESLRAQMRTDVTDLTRARKPDAEYEDGDY